MKQIDRCINYEMPLCTTFHPGASGGMRSLIVALPGYLFHFLAFLKMKPGAGHSVLEWVSMCVRKSE